MTSKRFDVDIAVFEPRSEQDAKRFFRSEIFLRKNLLALYFPKMDVFVFRNNLRGSVVKLLPREVAGAWADRELELKIKKGLVYTGSTQCLIDFFKRPYSTVFQNMADALEEDEDAF